MSNDTQDAQRADHRRSFLSLSVSNEEDRLAAHHGDENAPIGGWRNRAITNIAEREGMNPYSLDHLIRGIA